MGQDTLDAVCARLKDGGIAAIPTETVYGLAADASNAAAVAAVFAAKGRPAVNPLIVHVATLDHAERLAVFTTLARTLAARFWPGGLTLVLPLRPDARIAGAVTAGLTTIALRVPAHELARAVLQRTGLALAAPSANRSGEVSPTEAAHVRASLGSSVMVLDGGACSGGLESTVIGFDEGRAVLLRPGAVARAQIEAITGPLAEPRDQGARPSSPGRLLRHYAPRARLTLNVRAPSSSAYYLAFGPLPPGQFGESLSPKSDLAEAARQLYAALRRADNAGAAEIAVAPVPPGGLGEAINDRLTRAAAAQAVP